MSQVKPEHRKTRHAGNEKNGAQRTADKKASHFEIGAMLMDWQTEASRLMAKHGQGPKRGRGKRKR